MMAEPPSELPPGEQERVAVYAEASQETCGEGTAGDGYGEKYGYDASDEYDGSSNDYGDYDVPMEA